MGTVKRVLVFSPNPKTQEELESIVLKNFTPDFRLFKHEVIVQKFESIHDSYYRGAQIGVGGEILVLFDRGPLEAHTSKTERENRRVLLVAAKRVCDDKKIPYFDYYQRNIERREVMDNLRKGFYPLLESDVTFKY